MASSARNGFKGYALVGLNRAQIFIPKPGKDWALVNCNAIKPNGKRKRPTFEMYLSPDKNDNRFLQMVIG
jgi:hypothetical protein